HRPARLPWTEASAASPSTTTRCAGWTTATCGCSSGHSLGSEHHEEALDLHPFRPRRHDLRFGAGHHRVAELHGRSPGQTGADTGGTDLVGGAAHPRLVP